MSTISEDKNKTLTATAEAVAELISLMSAVDENKINSIPYEGSWTAPQLLSHVTKSINAMADALLTEAKPAERDPGERIEGLKEIFLNFSNKLNSPDFILPEEGIYERQPAIDQLQESFNRLNENANSSDLTELVEGLPFGPVTKLEIIHFALYHTQRHLHQMKKICEALKD